MLRTTILSALLAPLLFLGGSGSTELTLPCAASITVNGRACCKVCTKGQACGNSCISASYTCRKGAGCACDAGGPTKPARAKERPAISSTRRVAATRTRTPASTPTAVATVIREGRCTVASAGDGDTFTCSNGARVRLLLIDTPEKGQAPYGERARQALQELLPVGSIPRLEMDVDPQDRYGRVLAYAYTADGRMVNEEMARQGYALTLTYPPNVRHVERIRSAVQEARSAGRGLHATRAFACTPKEYRDGKCR